MITEKFLIDTDMGADCDDVPAVALAAWMHKTKQAELLGVTHTSSNPKLYEYIDSVVQFYGDICCDIGICRGDCPQIGRISDSYIEESVKGFQHRRVPDQMEDSVSLLRRKLANNEGVKLICIGPLNNLAALLRSAPDRHSPLQGTELVKHSVCEIALMGGIFGGKTYGAGDEKYDIEYNIQCDIAAAAFAVKNCPVPITFIEFELGYNVESFERTVLSKSDSPIRRAFEMFHVKKRPSWDPITVLYAKYGLCNGLYRYSPQGQAAVDREGRMHFSSGGQQRYLVENKSKKEITDFVNSFEIHLARGIL